MAGQGEVVITMAIPASTARGTLISGAGTKSATLRAVGAVVEGTSSTETKGAVQISGTALVLLGATLTAGAAIQANASGAAIASVTTDGSELLCCGVLLEGGASGELRTAKLV